MTIIGITGGIGSGKSTIARELARRGYAVYDSDSAAKRLITECAAIREQIIALLGAKAFVETTQGWVYNTSYVSEQVFANRELLVQLNRIVHPAVIADIQRQAASEETLFVESALLHESGIDDLCSAIVHVDAPEEIRIARTIQRDYAGDDCDANINKVRARIRAQQQSFTADQQKPIVLMNDGSVSIEQLADELISRL